MGSYAQPVSGHQASRGGLQRKFKSGGISGRQREDPRYFRSMRWLGLVDSYSRHMAKQEAMDITRKTQRDSMARYKQQQHVKPVQQPGMLRRMGAAVRGLFKARGE